MSETMVEKVAKAICESLEADIYDHLPERGIVKAAYRQQARAAIEAMREPDDAMRLASKRYKRTAKVYSGPECYRQMIDAASGAK